MPSPHTASIPVILSGLPGKMAAEVAAEIADCGTSAGISLAPVAFGSAAREGQAARVGNREFRILGPDARETYEIAPGVFVIDYTEPAVALANIDFYTQRRIPFVMGTTGFDLARARALVERAGIPAVIAPNMAIPIVLMQIALEHIAREFPGALAGHSFTITESHQATKKDTSGTAKAVVSDFARLGLPIAQSDIRMVRDPEVQSATLGVAPEHLAGHAYHFYELASPGRDLRMKLSHEIDGRRVYARGTLAAVRFLARRVHEGTRGAVYTMKDVARDMQH